MGVGKEWVEASALLAVKDANEARLYYIWSLKKYFIWLCLVLVVAQVLRSSLGHEVSLAAACKVFTRVSVPRVVSKHYPKTLTLQDITLSCSSLTWIGVPPSES